MSSRKSLRSNKGVPPIRYGFEQNVNQQQSETTIQTPVNNNDEVTTPVNNNDEVTTPVNINNEVTTPVNNNEEVTTPVAEYDLENQNGDSVDNFPTDTSLDNNTITGNADAVKILSTDTSVNNCVPEDGNKVDGSSTGTSLNENQTIITMTNVLSSTKNNPDVPCVKRSSSKSSKRSSNSSQVNKQRLALQAKIEFENKKQELADQCKRKQSEREALLEYELKMFDLENDINEDRESSVCSTEISRRTKEYVASLPSQTFYSAKDGKMTQDIVLDEPKFMQPAGEKKFKVPVDDTTKKTTAFIDKSKSTVPTHTSSTRDVPEKARSSVIKFKDVPPSSNTVDEKEVPHVREDIMLNQEPSPADNVPVTSTENDGNMLNVAKILNQLVNKMSSDSSGFGKRRIGELPTFTGNCEDWPIFKSEFLRSAEEGGFSDSELLRRLERAIKGAARQTVSALFVAPENVSEIMITLEETYGRPEWIMLLMSDKARKVPSPQDDKPESFIQFCNVISNFVVTAENIGQEMYLNNPELLLTLVCKMSDPMKIQWGQYALMYGSDLKTFSNWTKLMRNIKCSTNFPQHRSFQNTPDRKFIPSKPKLFLINNKGTKGSPGRSTGVKFGNNAVVKEVCYECCLCKTNNHKLKECNEFLAKDVAGKYDILKEFRVCFRCLDGKHFSLKCPNKRMCDVNGCDRYHHKLLHKDIIKEVVSHHGSSDVSKVLLRIIPVVLSGPKGSIKTAALCDEGSTITLIESSLANSLGISGSVKPLCYQWTNNITRSEDDSQTINISISEDAEDARTYTLKNVRTVVDLSLPQQSFDAEEMLRNYKHLGSVTDINNHGHLQPTILIGHDNYGLIAPREILEEANSDLIASKSKLGWAIHGKNDTSIISNFSYHMCQTSDVDDLHKLVKESFKLEESGLSKRTSLLSREDRLALDMMKKSLVFTGVRYQLPLLWKDKNVSLPESKANALRRLECLERKMDKNEDFGRQYCAKINEYVAKGFASKVESPQPCPREWYLPHFGVYNINKPNKIRFVFDAASRSHGKCLNDFLLQGPDLVPSLISVIWNFRIHAVAFSGDLKEMFHQVLIDPADQPSMRFLFRGMNRDRAPLTFQMNVMIFGAICSPSMAQFVKNENAKLYDDPDLEYAMTKLHYVDDYLDGSKDDDSALAKIRKIISAHKEAGFEMVNWICNSRKVLEALPSEILAKQNKNLNLENSETDRVLGLIWNSQKDCFVFSTNFEKIDSNIVNGTKVPTKRQVLQVAMSIFDPLQFLAPLMIKVKMLLQEVWRSGIEWDADITEAQQVKWKLWLEEIQNIKDFVIPRRYFKSLEDNSNIQLHVFGDASEKGYSAVAYLRCETVSTIELSYVSGKAKVAPLKHMTIPRLELQAAVMASRLVTSIVSDLSLQIHQIFYWTDSMVVLSWIKSSSKRFKMFVGNRVGEIAESTNANDWNWVPTSENPADAATRDSTSIDNICENQWFKGPDFLLKTKEFWPVQPQTKVEESDEIAEEVHTVNIICEKSVPLPEIKRFSKYLRLIRATAWIYRFVNNLKAKVTKESLTCGDLHPSEVEKAKMIWIVQVQSESFCEDRKFLRKHGFVQSNSRLFQLSPKLDDDNILRLDGRIKNAPVADCAKQPIILDSKHVFTEMLIQHQHELCMHTGKDLVTNLIRQQFWIINIKAAVKRCFHECRFCKNRKSKPDPPEMGPLPEYRLTPYVRPFNFCGVDYFGPIEVKIGRRIEKRYGVLFTCLTVRAIHIEVASSLDTSSTIMAIRRFVSIRGCPNEMWSDNGTNLKGADKELQLHLKSLDQSTLQQEMSVKGIRWHFIPPLSPHMGGSWERMIGLVKASIKSTLNEHHPREETLRSVLCEAQALVNSRPLTEISNDSNDGDCLTPNHFLIGTASTNPIPGTFEKFELTSRKQWRVSQALLEIFWKKWIVGYLPTLVQRKKWFKKVEPLKVGDMVKIRGEETRKGVYPLGVITKVFTGEDQQVRAAEVRTAKGSFVRPTVKLAAIDVWVGEKTLTGGSM